MAVESMDRHTCAKCGKTMADNQFYTYQDGSKTELCKKCLTMHIDNFNPETFLWLLQKMDVPYIEAEWNVLRDRAYAKDPAKMNGMSVFGKYLSKMKLGQWNKYRWADTEKLKAKEEAKKAAETAELQKFEEDIKGQYERGEITEAQYKTMTSVPTQVAEVPYGVAPCGNPVSGNPVGDSNMFNENDFLSESELIDPAAELTHEDKMYLAMKWGRLYKPSEWVELEKNYVNMMKSFNIEDADSINTLILICKTNLKANQALDMGDYDTYKKLSSVLDNLRKSAKFTAAQKKEEKADFIDSVGELVAYCEKYGGEIPRFEIKTPYDVVDKIIADLKDYNKSLVYEDTSLAQEIEDYLRNKRSAEEAERDKAEAKKKGLEQYELEDEDFIDYKEHLAKQREIDDMLLSEEVSLDEFSESIGTID